jgi:hypothetical protein
LPKFLACLPHVEIGASRTLPGTINALVVNYYGSDDWHKLAADTKKNRGRARLSAFVPSTATSAWHSCNASIS